MSVEAIIDDLPENAVTALILGSFRTPDLERPARLQLEFFELLQPESCDLTDLGRQVLVELLRRDLDFQDRQDKFSQAFGQLYRAAYYTTEKLQRPAHAALFCPCDARALLAALPLDAVAYIDDAYSISAAQELAARDLVTIELLARRTRRGSRAAGAGAAHVSITRLGTVAARFLRREAEIEEQIFTGSRPSAWMSASLREHNRMTEQATSTLASWLRREVSHG